MDLMRKLKIKFLINFRIFSEALSSSSSDILGVHPSSSSSRQHDLSESAKQIMKLFLKELLAVPGNDRCADCGCPDAKWTSLNLGVRLFWRLISANYF